MATSDGETEYLVPRARLDGPIVLAEADPSWPDSFNRLADRIRGALGPRALAVEHVGSTSVPALAARGAPEAERLVAFRDHLRADDRDRALYQATKRALAAQEWAVVQDYADAKSAVVEEILVRALRHGGPR